jgi:mannose/cellobiose epimerase-like protein (N-acyl-D-glucosamine 2-epimerase family)
MEYHLWEPRHGLYADEASANWQLSSYRGQNANMHVCEAMLAAFEATGEAPYLDRANTLAKALTRRQAALSGNLVWEHYHADWSVDWDYNRNDKTNKFRPWGYQTGHLTEWAKLLLQLERQAPAAWLIPQAEHFFNTAMARGWDPVYGGLVYGFDTEGQVCDDNKYFWVQAESAVAAAWLAERTGDSGYWVWYERLWSYMLQHFWDPQHGTWHNLLSNDNRLRGDQKSSSGKTDYHIMGACCDMLRAMNISHVGP